MLPSFQNKVKLLYAYLKSLSKLSINVPVLTPLKKILTKNDKRIVFILLVLSMLLILTYSFFNFVIPQTPGRMTRASATLIPEFSFWSKIASLPLPIPKVPETTGILLLSFCTLAFFIYLFAIYVTWNMKPKYSTLLLTVISGMIFFMVSVMAFPNVNTDIYNYILRGRVAAVNDANPYYVAADEFPNDPVYPYASHTYTANPGGKFPAWMVLNIFLAEISGDNVVTILLVYRFALFLINIFSILLIFFILKKINPDFLLTGLIIFAWNPIIVIFGQSKTDALMAFYLILAIFFFAYGRKNLGVISMALSVLVKLITLPLTAIYWLRELKLKRWRELLKMTLLLILTTVIIYLPFWKSPVLIFNHLSNLSEGGESTSGILQFVVRIAFIILIIVIGFLQNGSLKKLLIGWVLVELFFAFFVTKIVLSWYMITLISLICLIKDWRLLLLTVLISFSSFSINMWGSIFTSEFKIPDIPINRFLIYIGIPAAVLILITGIMILNYLLNQKRLIKSR